MLLKQLWYVIAAVTQSLNQRFMKRAGTVQSVTRNLILLILITLMNGLSIALYFYNCFYSSIHRFWGELVCLRLRRNVQVSIGGPAEIGDAIMTLRENILQTTKLIQGKVLKEDRRLNVGLGGLG